ncbi:MAG: hypothetical protein KGR68_06650, partial [Betaproteobacteria bacterium]|nr:hypothetical protein [Betaproteobacteria bacterium]
GAINVTGSRWHAGDSVTDLITGGIGQYTVRGENMIMVVAGAGTGAWAGSNAYMGYMGASGNLPTTGIGVGQDNGESVGANTSATGKYQGLKIAYSQGALVGSFDMQTSDTGPITAGASTTTPAGSKLERSAWKLGAGYRYSGAKSQNIVSIQYVERERTITTAAGAATKGKEDVVALVGQYDAGSGWLLNATYGVASDRKDNNVSVAGSGAKSYGLGVVKILSNRTHALFHFRVIDNDRAGTYGLAGGNYQSGTPAAGADSKGWGLGLVHLF